MMTPFVGAAGDDAPAPVIGIFMDGRDAIVNLYAYNLDCMEILKTQK